MQLWQCQHDFVLASLRTSRGVTAGSIAAISKLLVQALEGWTRSVQQNGVGSSALELPCVPRNKLYQTLSGLATHADPETVWPLRAVFSRLLASFKKLPVSSYAEFIAEGLIGAATVAIPLPGASEGNGETPLSEDESPAAMTALVEQLRDGKDRQRGAFGRLGQQDVQAVLASLERQLVKTSNACVDADPTTMSEPETATASVGELYRVVQLLIAVTSGPEGLRVSEEARDTAKQRVESAMSQCAGPNHMLQGISQLMQAICV
jgi:hypothetical protein